MKHPFETLKPEYSQLLSVMTVRPECRAKVDDIAAKILSVRRYFESVRTAIGVPVVFSGPSFYREANLNFDLSPAQGDPWRKVSTHVPAPVGPYPSWNAAAVAAYRMKGLDKIKVWTWELVCFYAELFNGMGYRDYHHMHSPYLWGGTNIQTIGKYVADREFDAHEMDSQIGVIPIGKRLVEISPDLAFVPIEIAPPVPSGLAPPPEGIVQEGVEWLQSVLHRLGFDITIDGNYGRETKHTVSLFQKAYGLVEDGGYAGPEVMKALKFAGDQLGEGEKTPAVLPTSHAETA